MLNIILSILVQVPGLAVDVMRIFCHTDCGNPYDMISYDFVVIRIEARAESQDLTCIAPNSDVVESQDLTCIPPISDVVE